MIVGRGTPACATTGRRATSPGHTDSKSDVRPDPPTDDNIGTALLAASDDVARTNIALEACARADVGAHGRGAQVAVVAPNHVVPAR